MRKNVVYVGLRDLKKTYDRVNREALWWVLRMYDVVGKLLKGIKSIYVIIPFSVRVKGGVYVCVSGSMGV